MAAPLETLRRATARVLIVALAPLALDGCVSTGVDRTAPPVNVSPALTTGSFEARLYDTGSAAKKDQKSQRTVSWKLFLPAKSADTPVREGTGNVWNAVDLEPGKYRIVAAWGPVPGVAGDTSAGTTDDTFKLAAGETAVARVIVKKFPTAAVVAVGLGIAGVAIAVIAIDNSFKHMFGNQQETQFDWSRSAAPARNASSPTRVR